MDLINQRYKYACSKWAEEAVRYEKMEGNGIQVIWQEGSAENQMRLTAFGDLDYLIFNTPNVKYQTYQARGLRDEFGDLAPWTSLDADAA